MLDLQTFAFDNTFARDMEGFYVPWQGAKVPAPKSLRVNAPLARELGIDPDFLNGPQGAAILSGAASPEGAAPLAMVYAGHQFGGFSAQLGDGRALLVGEVLDTNGTCRLTARRSTCRKSLFPVSCWRRKRTISRPGPRSIRRPDW